MLRIFPQTPMLRTLLSFFIFLYMSWFREVSITFKQRLKHEAKTSNRSLLWFTVCWVDTTLISWGAINPSDVPPPPPSLGIPSYLRTVQNRWPWPEEDQCARVLRVLFSQVRLELSQQFGWTCFDCGVKLVLCESVRTCVTKTLQGFKGVDLAKYSVTVATDNAHIN